MKMGANIYRQLGALKDSFYSTALVSQGSLGVEQQESYGAIVLHMAST